ncbi:transposase family protein [Desulfococcaceae bacterium HSG9]|nr:transposase family protein [Desulfococcaceae bacterium HSG9]
MDEAAIDGTERRRQRPKDNDEQKKYYSGKKRTHTIKNNIIVTAEERKVKYQSKTYEGEKHDKKIYDEKSPAFPEGIVLNKDTGLQEYEPKAEKERCLM